MKKSIPVLPDLTGWKDRSVDERHESYVSLNHLSPHIRCIPQHYRMGLPGTRHEMLVRSSVASRLLHASYNLPKHYSFVIWDTWRHPSTENVLHERCSMTDTSLAETWFPRFPGPHQTGGSLSLSILDANGRTLDMGTTFDEWTLHACTRYYEEKMEQGEVLSSEDITRLHNRRLLFHLMQDAGFVNHPACWYQFHYGNAYWAAATGEPACYHPSLLP